MVSVNTLNLGLSHGLKTDRHALPGYKSKKCINRTSILNSSSTTTVMDTLITPLLARNYRDRIYMSKNTRASPAFKVAGPVSFCCLANHGSTQQ
jgi:hypothetical protein